MSELQRGDFGQCVLLVDDDRLLTEGLALALERDGRTVLVCADVESAELALTRFAVSHLVSDVQFSGKFGFEGLHFVDRVRSVAPHCSVILMTGCATEDLEREARRFGAHALLAKPFEVAELELVIGAPPDQETSGSVVRIDSIEELLQSRAIRPMFQPIVRLDQPMGIAGFEALARVRGGWALGGAAELFEYAALRNRTSDVNVEAMARALELAPLLPEATSLFLNVDPPALSTASFARALLTEIDRNGIDSSRVVLEITEKSMLGQNANVETSLSMLRSAGIRFALDDQGSAYSHLSLISMIQPSFIKVSQEFGTNFEQDEMRQRIVRHLFSLAHDFGCQTVLEGIETAATAAAAVEAGADLAQGFFFSKAEEASIWSSSTCIGRAA